MKKVLTLNEEIKRMKSLMSEERLYGNLIDSPPKKKVITEGVPWKALWQAVKTASKETPDLALTLISKSYIGKVNKALSKLPESGILAAKQAQEIMDIAKGLAKNMSVADNITKVFKLAKIPLDGPDIGSMRNMLVNMQALILRGVARGDNATIIAKDINAIAKSTSLTPQDITDFAHLVFNSTKINKILGESQLAKALEDLTKVDIDAYFKMLTTMSPGDLRGVDDLVNAVTKNADDMTESGLKELFKGSNMEKAAKLGLWSFKTVKAGLKTLFFRFDIPPITRQLEKWGWGRKLLQSKLLTGKKYRVSLAQAPMWWGIYECLSEPLAEVIANYYKKGSEEGLGPVEIDKTTLTYFVPSCLAHYVKGSSLTIPRGIAYLDDWTFNLKDREVNIQKENFKKWLINRVCEDAGNQKTVNGTLSCDWAAIQEKYPDCESLKGPDGPIEQYKEEAIEQNWFRTLIDYGAKKLSLDEEIKLFKDQVAEQLTNDPQLCKWFAENLHLDWEMTKENLEEMVEDGVQVNAIDPDQTALDIIVGDIKNKLIKTGMQCNYLPQWKQAVLSQAKRDSGDYDKYDNGKEGFKTWWCNYKYGEGTAYSKEAATDYLSACKQAVDQWCP